MQDDLPILEYKNMQASSDGAHGERGQDLWIWAIHKSKQSMIRGVNKNVIEISDTGNDCFERAILFVRPDKVEKDSDHIRRRAVDYLSGVKLRPWFYPKGRTALRVIGWVTSALVGAAVTSLFFLL